MTPIITCLACCIWFKNQVQNQFFSSKRSLCVCVILGVHSSCGEEDGEVHCARGSRHTRWMSAGQTGECCCVWLWFGSHIKEWNRRRCWWRKHFLTYSSKTPHSGSIIFGSGDWAGHARCSVSLSCSSNNSVTRALIQPSHSLNNAMWN